MGRNSISLCILRERLVYRNLYQKTLFPPTPIFDLFVSEEARQNHPVNKTILYDFVNLVVNQVFIAVYAFYSDNKNKRQLLL